MDPGNTYKKLPIHPGRHETRSMTPEPAKVTPGLHEMGHAAVADVISSEMPKQETSYDTTAAEVLAPPACMASTKEPALDALGSAVPNQGAFRSADDALIAPIVAACPTENDTSMPGVAQDVTKTHGKDAPTEVSASHALSITLYFHAMISNTMPEEGLVKTEEGSGLSAEAAETSAIGARPNTAEEGRNADEDGEDAANELTSILADATLIGLENRAVPSSFQALLNWHPDPEYKTLDITFIIRRYMVDLKKKKELGTIKRQAVYDFLKSVSLLQDFDTTRARQSGIEMLLKGVTGEAALNLPFEFPDPFPALAAHVLGIIESNSGYEEVVAAEDVAPATNPKKRKHGKEPTSRVVETPVVSMNDPAVRAEIGAILDNVQRSGENGRNWKISDKTLITSSKRFGHNGLRIGQCWPFRVCALRDGAHGIGQAGIAGDQKDGARSIVISGGYEDMDRDEGHIVYYSGSDSHKNTDSENAQWSQGTKVMKRSFETKTPIRVLRGWKGIPGLAPAVGFRYDGLYEIKAMDTKAINKNGGAYVRFTLKRCRGQHDIATDRPTQAEKEAFRTCSKIA